MHKVAIIVLNWNSAKDSIDCAKSLLSQDAGITLIVVDNASSDNSISLLKRFVENNKESNVVLLENSVNLGFSGGINTGMEYALKKGFTYIGTLNSDAVAGIKWSQSLVRELESHPDSGIATGLLLSRDGSRVDSSGEFYSTWGLAFPRDRGKRKDETPREPGYIFGSTGGAVIYRSEMLREIGLFDEKFFMYYEDVDISFRAQLTGYKVRFTPDAIAYHSQGASSKKVPGLIVYNTFKNLPILLYKNVPTAIMWKILPRFYIMYSLFYVNALLHRSGWPATKGVLKSVTLLPHAFINRWRIQRNKKVSSKYISSILWRGLPPK